MLKSIVIMCFLFSSSLALACGGEPTLRTPAEIAEEVSGETLNCNYNGVTSKGKITVSYARCPGAPANVRLQAFDDVYQVNELSTEGDGVLKVITDSLDFAILCVVQ